MLHLIGRINHLSATELQRAAPSWPVGDIKRTLPARFPTVFPWRDRDGLESGDWPLVVQLSVESILITPATGG